MKHILTFSLVFTGILSAQSLNHDYNMGRIVGGDYRFTTLLSEVDSDILFIAPMQRYRMGVADRYQWDLDLVGYLQSTPDRLEYSLGAVRLGGIYKIQDGNMLDWSVANSNIAISGTGHSIVSGFNEKYDRNLDLSLGNNYLSRDGYIFQSSDELALSFLRGPLLDAGQYRHILGFATHQGNHSDERVDFQYAPYLGITDQLELWAYADLSLTDPNGAGNWNNLLQLGTEFRLSRLWLNAQAYSTDLSTEAQATQFDEYTYQASAGLLLGKSTRTFRQVEGNYDRYFSPMLEGGQLLLTHKLVSGFYDSQGGSRYYDWNSHAGVGITSEFGVYANLSQKKGHPSPNFSTLSLGTIYSNIPLRTEGPYDVTDLEYLWGYIFQPGDWRITALWRTPWLDPEKNSGNLNSPLWRDNSVHIDHFSSTPYSNSSDAQMDFSAILGLAESWFGKLEYSYYRYGLFLNADSENPGWEGRTHVATLALGYTQFNAIWELGAQMQSGQYPEKDNTARNVFPIYFKSIARF